MTDELIVIVREEKLAADCPNHDLPEVIEN